MTRRHNLEAKGPQKGFAKKNPPEGNKGREKSKQTRERVRKATLMALTPNR